MNQQEGKQTDPLLAQALTLRQLPGLIGKRWVIPAGRQGVVLQSDGSSRLLGAGRQRLLSAWGRLRGRGAGLGLGLVPAGEFTLPIRIPYLLSGDGELLDLSLACLAELSDPARFFINVVAPQGTVTMLDLSDEESQQALGAVTRRYLAQDLVHGKPPRLHGELAAALEPRLAPNGIRLLAIPLLVISPAGERERLAEKTLQLEAQLAQVAPEQVRSQADLDRLLQAEPGLEKQINIQAGGEPGQADSLAASLRSALAAGRSDAPRRHFRLADLFRRKKEEENLLGKPHRPKPLWWLPRTLWLVFVFAIAAVVTILVLLLTGQASENRTEILLGVWSFAVLAGLESAKALYDKYEKMEEAVWMLPGFTRLDDLTGNDRLRTDALVRQDCGRELKHILDLLQEVRTREYKRGSTDLALALRNQTEKLVADCMEKVGRSDFGRPPYVTDLHISRRGWNELLDYDEDLLLRVNALGNQAAQVAQRSIEGSLDEKLLKELESDLTVFCNAFHERSRALKRAAAK